MGGAVDLTSAVSMFTMRPMSTVAAALRRSMAFQSSIIASSTPTAKATRATGSFAAIAMGSAATYSWCAMEDTPPTSLSPKEFRSFPVIATEKLSSDTVQIRLGLESPEHVLGMSTASCHSISAEIDGHQVSKPYTPTSTRLQKGHVDFVVKAYPARTGGKPGGMGRHINSLG